MTNTETIKTALIKQIIDSGSTLPLSVLEGNIDLLISSAQTYQCSANSNNVVRSYLIEPELTVKDLKAGEWYVFNFSDNFYIYMGKFYCIDDDKILTTKLATLGHGIDDSKGFTWLTMIQDVESIRHATREEIIKYFPHEFEIDTHGGNDIPQVTDPQL